MASSRSDLNSLQRDLLAAFFERTQEFFLTGGAALAGFHLHHRETRDLDVFATPGADLEAGARALTEAATAIGATARVLQASADFRRFVVERNHETTLMDMVIDRAPQIVPAKSAFGVIRIDPPREIAANKLCALLDRTEPRDLVDLKLLLETGMALEDVLSDAQRKHAGADPATLAWALSQGRPGPSAPAAAGISRRDIEAFRDELVVRLRRLAAPDE
jgi:hypothetical protein